jgi:hypothetical protein
VLLGRVPLQGRRHHGVIIPIRQLEDLAKARGNPLHPAHAKLFIRPHGDAPCMDPLRRKPCGNHRPHPVPCLHAHHLLRAHQIANGEPLFIDIGPAVAPATGGGDRKGCVPTHLNSSKIPHAQRVQRVRLRERESRPVPPRAPTAPGDERQARRAQVVTERRTRSIDDCGVPQWLLRLSLDRGMTELRGGVLSFGGIARVATERQIGHAVGATPTLWLDVVQLERRVRAPAIGTSVFTRSTSRRTSGIQRRYRLAQDTTLSTRERREGGSQPGGRRRLRKRGAR